MKTVVDGAIAHEHDAREAGALLEIREHIRPSVALDHHAARGPAPPLLMTITDQSWRADQKRPGPTPSGVI
jgi:hypothetical protein